MESRMRLAQQLSLSAVSSARDTTVSSLLLVGLIHLTGVSRRLQHKNELSLASRSKLRLRCVSASTNNACPASTSFAMISPRHARRWWIAIEQSVSCNARNAVLWPT
jgi:hypothetical protein